jgi:hypothetical protein
MVAMQSVEGSQGFEEDTMIQNVQRTSEATNFAQKIGALLGSLAHGFL